MACFVSSLLMFGHPLWYHLEHRSQPTCKNDVFPIFMIVELYFSLWFQASVQKLPTLWACWCNV